MRKTFKPAKATIALSVIAALVGALSAPGSVDRLASLWQDDAPRSASALHADSAALELRSANRESGGQAPDPEYAADTAASAATSPLIPIAPQANEHQPAAALDGDRSDASTTGTATPSEAVLITSEEAIEQERIQQETLSQHTESDSAGMPSPTAEEEAALREYEENLQAAAAVAETTVETGPDNNTAAESN